MDKSKQILALRAKAEDSSLSQHERNSSRRMAEKLVKKHNADAAGREEQVWIIPVKKYAKRHPKYEEFLADTLRSWGFNTIEHNNVEHWEINNLELAIKTQKLMTMLSMNQIITENQRRSKINHSRSKIKKTQLYKGLVWFGLVGVIFLASLVVLL